MAASGPTFEALATAFRHRNFKPLYFFYGEESFLTEELEHLLTEHALASHERDFNLDILHGTECDAPTALVRCAGYPMMAERRVVIVRHFDKLKDNVRFTEYAKAPNPTAVVLLLCDGKPNLSQNPYRALKQHAEAFEAKPLYERQMPGWIDQRVKAVGREIEPQAVQMLAGFLGTDLRTTAVEIDKLLVYIGERRRITSDDVLRAGGHARAYNVFELQKAIGERRFEHAVEIAERMLQQASNRRSEALMMVAVLSGYLTKLWKLTLCQAERVPESQMAGRIGVNPFFLKEYLHTLNRYTLSDIEQAFAALLAADYELKGGSSREEHLVLILALRRIMQHQRGFSTPV